MVRHLLRPALAAALLAVLPAAAAAQSGAWDFLRTKGATDEKRVRVLAVTWEGVVYSLGTPGQLTEPLTHVIEIEFHDTPSALPRAEEALKRGEIDAAQAELQKALDAVDAKKCRPLHRQYALIALQRLHATKGEWGAVVKTGLRLLDASPDSAFLREAYERACACAAWSADRAALDTLQARLRKEPPRLGLAPRADLAAAWSLFHGGRHAEAADRFKPLAAGADPVLQADARVGMIRCLAAERKPDALRKACEEAVHGDNRDGALLGAAWLGLADLAEAKADQAKDAASRKEALMHCLRVVVLHAPAPGAPTADHEKALFQAARGFERIAESLPAAETKAEYRRRAKALYEELLKEYPASAWKPRAEQALAAMRI